MEKLLTLNLLLASITLSLIPASYAASTDSARYTLEKVVMLSRHGVRPQTDTASLEEATGGIAWKVNREIYRQNVALAAEVAKELASTPRYTD